ncbi:MAG TPA: LysR family transcriptional regulator [Erysipelotrichaceae bacterium]|jgi:DNA-binding transcriptional LysR family regulator|nr:LysR family transcriptional regulator [Erysipelotrichaceae bacterium]HQA85332.1 LysR family transcriptional regulator [Erysipelotrichaceae bacterium]
MDIKQLNYFLTIAQEGSISAAARKLYMSQPPLSAQMKILEEELGCSLFVRGSKNISLTEEGKILYQRAESILNQIKSTTLEIKEASRFEVIRIGVISSIVEEVSKLLSDFHLKNDKVIYEITEANTYHLLDLLKDGTINVAFVREPYPNGGFKQLKLFEDKLVAVGKDLPEKIDLTYLSKKPLILYRRWIEVIREQFDSIDIPFDYICLNDDARTTISLVKKGLGIGLVPLSSVDKNTNLDIRNVVDSTIATSVNMVYLPNSYKSASCNKLIKYIEEITKK